MNSIGARRRRRLATLAATIGLPAVMLTSTLAFAQGSAPSGPRVFPRTSTPYGNSYGDWSTIWWQWAYSQPVAGHPLFDETGVNCGAGQAGPVFFLGGVFNVSGTAVRTECVVPAGKALFFPILNVAAENTGTEGVTRENELRVGAASLVDQAADLALEVDGTSVGPLAHFRVPSPAFHFRLPEHNIIQAFGVFAPAGWCFPEGELCEPYRAVADGFYVMLAPLPPGPHTIHFRGSFPAFGFTLDVTYHLTVEP